MKKHLELRPVVMLAALSFAGLVAGCAEQPYGYIFSPKSRDQINAARQSASFISGLYDHVDQAAVLLYDAGLTSEYNSILPEGWNDATVYDDAGNPVGPNYTFQRNFLDQKYEALYIEKEPIPGAVRNPSRVTYDYFEVASLANPITNEYYGSVAQTRKLTLNYADNYTNLNSVEGWYTSRKQVPFEQEFEVSIGSGRSVSQTRLVYLPVRMNMRITGYSLDRNNQRGRVVMDGLFPILDETGNIQQAHITCEFNIKADGTGIGEVRLFGEPAARIIFTGRTFGFTGRFSLYREDHKFNYNL